jgi:hypothetical protein
VIDRLYGIYLQYTQRHHKAAVIIQQWYRSIKRHRTQSLNEHAMKEILETKRQKLLQQWNGDAMRLTTDEDRQRQKDEKARIARLEAIEVG